MSTSANQSSDSQAIPQSVYDHYNADYNNQTYRAFTGTLAGCIPNGVTDQRYLDIANLLIDASFERCSPEFYRGSCSRLAEELASLDCSEMYLLAEAHLRNFDSDTAEVQSGDQALEK